MRIFLTLVLLTSGLACEKTIREAKREVASDAPTAAADSASVASSRSSDERA